MLDERLRDGERKLAESGLGFTGSNNAPGNSQRLTREYLDSMKIEFRLIDSPTVSTRTDFFGSSLTMPIMVTALSGLERIRPDGMAQCATGAAEAGTAMWVGVGDEEELGKVVKTGVKTVKIVKPYRDVDLILQKIAKAEEVGATAIGMDISFSFGMKNGFAPAPMSPKSAAELRSFVRATSLPFILKGVLSESDAEKAIEMGAAGIMLSHQGGTVLDFAIPPPKLLPRIVKLVAGRIPVFVDCCVESGLDAFKVLALGASGVGVGRKVMLGLAADGAAGVRQALEDMNRELARVMGMTGIPNIPAMTPTVLWR